MVRSLSLSSFPPGRCRPRKKENCWHACCLNNGTVQDRVSFHEGPRFFQTSSKSAGIASTPSLPIWFVVRPMTFPASVESCCDGRAAAFLITYSSPKGERRQFAGRRTGERRRTGHLLQLNPLERYWQIRRSSATEQRMLLCTKYCNKQFPT